MMHLSPPRRSYLVLAEFGFMVLNDVFHCLSIMPQKKTRFAELIRGKTARVYGDSAALCDDEVRRLPTTRIQEDKEAERWTR